MKRLNYIFFISTLFIVNTNIVYSKNLEKFEDFSLAFSSIRVTEFYSDNDTILQKAEYRSSTSQKFEFRYNPVSSKYFFAGLGASYGKFKFNPTNTFQQSSGEMVLYGIEVGAGIASIKFKGTNINPGIVVSGLYGLSRITVKEPEVKDTGYYLGWRFRVTRFILPQISFFFSSINLDQNLGPNKLYSKFAEIGFSTDFHF